MEGKVEIVKQVPQNATNASIANDFLSFLASTNDSECEKLYTFAVDALTFANKVHIWHWSCNSGFQHTHFEVIYDTIRDFADKLVETVMSMGYKFTLRSKTYLINDEKYELASAILKLQAFRDELEAKKKQYSTKVSLENLFGDVIETIDREIGLLKNFA